MRSDSIKADNASQKSGLSFVFIVDRVSDVKFVGCLFSLVINSERIFLNPHVYLSRSLAPTRTLFFSTTTFVTSFFLLCTCTRARFLCLFYFSLGSRIRQDEDLGEDLQSVSGEAHPEIIEDHQALLQDLDAHCSAFEESLHRESSSADTSSEAELPLEEAVVAFPASSSGATAAKTVAPIDKPRPADMSSCTETAMPPAEAAVTFREPAITSPGGDSVQETGHSEDIIADKDEDTLSLLSQAVRSTELPSASTQANAVSPQTAEEADSDR